MNPSLKDLEIFIGDWVMELSNASFLPDAKAIIRGSTSFEWIESGDYLVMRQGRKGIDANYATWIISRDLDSSNYTVLYSDDRGVSRVYEMSFEKGIWKMWRNSLKFSQRFNGELSGDKKSIQAHWEKSSDGKTWEHDFDIHYTKEKGA